MCSLKSDVFYDMQTLRILSFLYGMTPLIVVYSITLVTTFP